MGCPACAAGGFCGGLIGGYFGINQPETQKGRILSGLLSSTLTLVTLVGLKVCFNITLCGGASQPTINKFCRLVVAGLLLGTIYSIAINYVLNRCVTLKSSSENGVSSCGRKEGCQCSHQTM